MGEVRPGPIRRSECNIRRCHYTLQESSLVRLHRPMHLSTILSPGPRYGAILEITERCPARRIGSETWDFRNLSPKRPKLPRVRCRGWLMNNPVICGGAPQKRGGNRG